MRMFSYQVRAGRWKPSPCGPCCLITQINITSTTAPSLHPPALRRWNGSSLNTPWLYQKSRSAGVHHMYTHTQAPTATDQCSFLSEHLNIKNHDLLSIHSFRLNAPLGIGVILQHSWLSLRKSFFWNHWQQLRQLHWCSIVCDEACMLYVNVQFYMCMQSYSCGASK